MTLGYLQNNNLDFTLRHYFLRGLRSAGIILYTRQGGQRGRQASVECFTILQKIKFADSLHICVFFHRTAVLFHAVDPKTNNVVDKDIVIE